VASKEELECEDHSIKSFYRLPSGAYSVRSSLKPHAKALGDSYTQAHRRSLNLERKLQRNPHLKHKYDAFIKKYLDDDGWSLEICDVNYRVALDILNKRFNNKLLVFQAHIKEILGLKRLESASAVA